jgi:hypothetical protein
MKPTVDSGKFEALIEKMTEADVFEDPTVKQVVFSQYKEVVYLVAGELKARGVKVEIISGDQNKQGQRRAIKESFQSGDTQVLCIVTTAGGVSLTLDAADTAHMLDDMWSPDETASTGPAVCTTSPSFTTEPRTPSTSTCRKLLAKRRRHRRRSSMQGAR